MRENPTKRFVKKDGNQRISFYFDDDAENPRHTTDYPLHCEDWSREYSIMDVSERKNSTRSGNARSLLGWLFREYGDHKKALKVLFDNGKHMNDGKAVCSDALVYNKKNMEWEHMYCGSHYNYETKNNEAEWYVYDSFCCKKEELEIDDVIDSVEYKTIEYLIANCMTDTVKLASYHFGYYGSVSFDDEVSCKSDGICWVEKEAFLKYGFKEEDWKKPLSEVCWLFDALKHWADNEVYGFVVEDCIKSHVHKTYSNVEREDEDYDEEEWEDSDSCWGFYGELNEVEGDMFECAGLDREEFDEVNV